MLDRDFIVIVGNQGFGKSTWAKHYAKTKPRRFVFDPMRSYSGVDFDSDPSDWVPDFVTNPPKTFSRGTFIREEIEPLAYTAYAVGDCVFIIEECAVVFQRGEQLQDWAKPLIFMGRHKRVSLVLIAQRAAKIPIDIRSQATRFISFRQTEPDDVSAVVDRIGEAGEELPYLEKLACIDWNNGSLSRYSIGPA